MNQGHVAVLDLVREPTAIHDQLVVPGLLGVVHGLVLEAHVDAVASWKRIVIVVVAVTVMIPIGIINDHVTTMTSRTPLDVLHVPIRRVIDLSGARRIKIEIGITKIRIGILRTETVSIGDEAKIM